MIEDFVIKRKLSRYHKKRSPDNEKRFRRKLCRNYEKIEKERGMVSWYKKYDDGFPLTSEIEFIEVDCVQSKNLLRFKKKSFIQDFHAI